MNTIIKKMGKASTIFCGIGAGVVGLVILGISLLAFINYKEYDGKATATIVEIEKEEVENITGSENNINEVEYDYTVYVSYTVDDKKYEHIKFDSYDSSMKVGKTIEIQYDKDDPSKIQGKNGRTFIIIFIVLGSLVTIFGIYEIIKGIKIEKENPMYSVMR